MIALIESLKVEKELSDIIVKIVDIISTEDMAIEIKLRELNAQKDESIEKMAGIAEYKIRRMEISKIRKAVKDVIQKSTNRMVLAAIKPANN